ncbi:factor-independent urate hydroxylase [Siminovitchia sp. FSL H7-0308]|uniref:Uricase n=1 Tax=Siminovitchia thermophila TaxID=1245522 RepID=A0ABS2R536_9BACI|nr:urate oxidase [Siminovitchia thermophila]MBM7714028.1 urate oxidase [Siminovitchia thermophila]ONK21626.1 urate oxidase [Bacillus sp. VT-16-64]
MSSQKRLMYYGKGDVFVFRTYQKPLDGIKAIPESGFTGRNNVIFGMNAKIALEGEFLESFTKADNSRVVATDSMKNFILRKAAEYHGSTFEGFLHFVCKRFLDVYSHITAVEITADEIPFEAVQVAGDTHLETSPLVYRHSRNELITTTVKVQRSKAGYELAKQESGIRDLHLIKVSGSSFYGYIRDEYTTLPEAKDRPLYIYLDILYRYNKKEDAVADNPAVYVPAEQVRDIAASVFHEADNKSIQDLIYRIGLRVLQRFPQLAEVQFLSNNRTWEAVIEDIPGYKGAVWTEPRPPYGFQGFVVSRQDLVNEGLEKAKESVKA